MTSENSPCDFLSAKNSAGTRFLLHDGAVLSCTNKASGSNYSYIWVNANCAAILDVTGEKIVVKVESLKMMLLLR